MFDIGFLELMVILVIALLVIGPERMPEVARKIGSFAGKMRRFVESVKSEGEVAETINDFKKSMNLEEEKRQITSISDELNKGLSVGLDGVDLDSLHRPFGQSNASTETQSTQTSQFNKAPAQPMQPNNTQSQVSETPKATSDAPSQPVQTTQMSESKASTEPLPETPKPKTTVEVEKA